MIVQFYTIHSKKITVKNVESIDEAKFKLIEIGFKIDNIFKTDINIEEAHARSSNQ